MPDLAHPGESSRCARGVSAFIPWALFGVGVFAGAVAVAVHPSQARSAAAQDWPPFVLVVGLLLIGLVAQEDGLFAAVGYQLARTSSNGIALFIGAAVMISVVTATRRHVGGVPHSRSRLYGTEPR